MSAVWHPCLVHQAMPITRRLTAYLEITFISPFTAIQSIQTLLAMSAMPDRVLPECIYMNLTSDLMVMKQYGVN